MFRHTNQINLNGHLVNTLHVGSFLSPFYSEHKHLRRETRRHCENLLTAQGYQLTKHLSNTLAYLP
ncbi:MAG: hypothetical protein ACREYE_13015 [Gammaproteobacteria bacterium]